VGKPIESNPARNRPHRTPRYRSWYASRRDDVGTHRAWCYILVVWRLTLKEHGASDGEGARRYGGRWNRPGTPVIYTSGTLSLAVLEYLVHVDSDILPDSLLSFRVTIPDSLAMETIQISDLPDDWRDTTIPVNLQELGSAWVVRGQSSVLKVPSVVIPHEWNYVLNPAHPEFSRITWDTGTRFSFDLRLLK
jgi:RES domain-containing protein